MSSRWGTDLDGVDWVESDIDGAGFWICCGSYYKSTVESSNCSGSWLLQAQIYSINGIVGDIDCRAGRAVV